MNPDSMTQVLSHARKNTCAGVRCMRGLSVVFTPSVAYERIAIACKRNNLKEKKVHLILMSVTMKKIATTQTVAIPRKRNLLMALCRTTSSLSLVRHAQSLRRAKRMVEVLGELGQIIEKDVL